MENMGSNIAMAENRNKPRESLTSSNALKGVWVGKSHIGLPMHSATLDALLDLYKFKHVT